MSLLAVAVLAGDLIAVARSGDPDREPPSTRYLGTIKAKVENFYVPTKVSTGNKETLPLCKTKKVETLCLEAAKTLGDPSF